MNDPLPRVPAPATPLAAAAAVPAPGLAAAADAVPDAARPAPALSPGFAAVVLGMLLGLQPITTDVMLPALPALAADLHAPMAPVQMTMSVLMLAFGLAQLVWGPVADRYGRRPVLLAGLSLYALAGLAAAAAGAVGAVVAWRALQGAALAAAVVSARAMVRDLYPPQQGAMVMARAMSALGVLAIASPLVGGLLVAAFGWRAAPTAMAVFGIALGLFIARRVPETAPLVEGRRVSVGALRQQLAAIFRHPAFRAWALLVTCSYAGLFIFLASSAFVLIRVLGLPTALAGMVISTCSVAYILGTLLCRRWIARHGLVGTVSRGALVSLAAFVALLLLAITDARHVLAVMLPCWLYSMAHGIHMPAGQAGAVAPFPHAAGLASALAGFMLATGAFFIGLWLGQALDDSVRPVALGMACAAGATALTALTLVRRHGAGMR